jgi:hypothetical protein
MRGRANLGDPDERLRLARWGQKNGLLEPARLEARYALEMRPGHRETRQLLKLIELGLANRAESRPIEARQGPAAPALPRLDLSYETESTFRTRVQPVLMNACVNCHSGGRGGRFQLERAYENAQRAATQRNLAAVFAQINLDKPATSPLLIKALSPHGNVNTPPLPGRSAPAYHAIVHWLDQAVTNNPHLVERLAPHVASQPTRLRQTGFRETAPPPPAVVSKTRPRVPEQQPKQAKQPAAPADEFDPVLFNQPTK